MPVLHPIRTTLKQPAQFGQPQRFLASGDFPSRAEARRRVCEEFDFRDFSGRLRVSSCTAALDAMEREELITLPPSRGRGRRGPPADLGHAVPAAAAVPDRADFIKGPCLVLVVDYAHRRIWNELMKREHPRGAVFHAGCQIRYLVNSKHGWLAAAGFSSASIKLKARDDWIGWDEEARSLHLPLVTGLSRFLIRPSIAERRWRHPIGPAWGRVPDVGASRLPARRSR